MPDGLPEAQVPQVRKLLHDVNDELSIAVLQLEMMLEAGTVEVQSRESLEESLDACRKAAESLKQVWVILGPRPLS
jgi:hypothetical protein